jgi:hypothetical protein
MTMNDAMETYERMFDRLTRADNRIAREIFRGWMGCLEFVEKDGENDEYINMTEHECRVPDVKNMRDFCANWIGELPESIAERLDRVDDAMLSAIGHDLFITAQGCADGFLDRREVCGESVARALSRHADCVNGYEIVTDVIDGVTVVYAEGRPRKAA